VNIRKSSEFRLPGHAEEDDEEDKIGYNGNLDEEEKGYFNRPAGGAFGGTSIRSSYDASAAIDRLSVAAAGGGGGGGYSATSAMTEAVFLTGGDKTGFSPAKKSITPSKGNGSLSPKSSSSSAAFQSPMDRVSAALAARAAKDTNVNRNSGAGGASTAATYIDKDFESSRRSSGMTMAINNGADDEPKGYGISAAEESIARTESYLRQRLGAAGAGGASSAAPRGTGASAAVALAASKGDVGRNVKFRDDDGDDGEDMVANISLGAPSHKPMSPPSQSQSHSLMNDSSTTTGKKSGGVVYPYETADGGGGGGGVRRKSKTIKAEATANSMMTGSASQPALELPKIKTTSNGNASGNNSGRAGSGSSKRAKK
jgi:hypothetical protein